jgi:hypothetical protein
MPLILHGYGTWTRAQVRTLALGTPGVQARLLKEEKKTGA